MPYNKDTTKRESDIKKSGRNPRKGGTNRWTIKSLKKIKPEGVSEIKSKIDMRFDFHPVSSIRDAYRTMKTEKEGSHGELAAYN